MVISRGILAAAAGAGPIAEAAPRGASVGAQAQPLERTPALRVRTVARNLDIPWDLTFLPSGAMLYTERDRERIWWRGRGGERRVVVDSPPGIWHRGETGLMSILAARDFGSSRHFFTCHGAERGHGHDIRVVMWRLNVRATDARRVKAIVPGLPIRSGRHGGCRLRYGASGALFVGTGDAAVGRNPQNLRSGGGKVLRVRPHNGAGWPRNPFEDSAHPMQRRVFTYGHRNVQGLALRADGRMWSVEHGTYRDDEVNRLREGGNYGWNPVPGYDETKPMTDFSLPGRQIGARWRSGNPTLATSGAAWLRGTHWGRCALGPLAGLPRRRDTGQPVAADHAVPGRRQLRPDVATASARRQVRPAAQRRPRSRQCPLRHDRQRCRHRPHPARGAVTVRRHALRPHPWAVRRRSSGTLAPMLKSGSLTAFRPVGIGCVVLCLALTACGGGGDEAESSEQNSRDGETLTQFSPLTGLETPDGLPNHPIMVVKIDNTPAAEPQMGLGDAELVVEELVEGGSTRLAAFFWTQTPGEVGPVRSMRTTDVGIVSPADGVLVASGGAPPAKKAIRQAGIKTFTEGTGYSRDSDRAAPYNLMVDLGKLAGKIGEAEPPGRYLPFDGADEFAGTKPANTVDVEFSAGHTTTWSFEKGTGWVREDDLSAQGDDLVPDTVLALEVKVGDAGYLDPAGNPVPESEFFGNGSGVVFHDGKALPCEWSKNGPGGSLELTSKGGQPVTVPAGHTWIELVPKRGGDVGYQG